MKLFIYNDVRFHCNVDSNNTLKMEEEIKDKSFNDFFNGILKEFGTNIPQISIIITVIIGSLGFSQLFNAGAWTITTLLCFSVIFIFRRQISSNVKAYGIFSFLFILLGILLPLLSFTKAEIINIVNNQHILFSAYTSFFITIPLAIIIVSYRKQETEHGLTYPNEIQQAINNQILKSSFYKKEIKYIITFKELNTDHVLIQTFLKYTVVNRTKNENKWIAQLRTDDKTFMMKEFSINEEEVFFKDEKYRVNNGFRFEQMIPPKGEKIFQFLAEAKYPISGSEFYSTWDIATDEIVEIINPFEDIILNFEIRHDRYSEESLVKKMDNKYIIEFKDGLLPYQGLRLNWHLL